MSNVEAAVIVIFIVEDSMQARSFYKCSYKYNWSKPDDDGEIL